jgi:hypothetical protein
MDDLEKKREAYLEELRYMDFHLLHKAERLSAELNRINDLRAKLNKLMLIEVYGSENLEED